MGGAVILSRSVHFSTDDEFTEARRRALDPFELWITQSFGLFVA
jgi:hypothetical protein